MPKLKPLKRLLTERGPLPVLAVVGAMLFGIIAPASAQLFPFFNNQPQRQQRGGGWFGGNSGPFFAPFQQQPPMQQQRPAERQDFSRAPPPEKRDTQTERNVLVLGDAMADWLAYGLEDALSETPELGVTRKHKTVSGLLRYQPKGEPSDWVAAAKEILANEKPEAIVVMLGLHDRTAIREPVTEKKTDKKDAGSKTDGKVDNKADNKTAATPEAPADADNKPGDADDDGDTPQILTPERTTRSPQGIYQFRDERWGELYSKKIDAMIAVLKSKGVPVLWVGLPAIRGTKSTADALYLDSLYRDAAGRGGPLHAAGPGLRRPDPPPAFQRRRILHQGRRAQAGALRRARNHSPARQSLQRHRNSSRNHDARCQRQAGRSGAAPDRRADHAAGGVVGRHR